MHVLFVPQPPLLDAHGFVLVQLPPVDDMYPELHVQVDTPSEGLLHVENDPQYPPDMRQGLPSRQFVPLLNGE